MNAFSRISLIQIVIKLGLIDKMDHILRFDYNFYKKYSQQISMILIQNNTRLTVFEKSIRTMKRYNLNPETILYMIHNELPNIDRHLKTMPISKLKKVFMRESIKILISYIINFYPKEAESM